MIGITCCTSVRSTVATIMWTDVTVNMKPHASLESHRSIGSPCGLLLRNGSAAVTKKDTASREKYAIFV